MKHIFPTSIFYCVLKFSVFIILFGLPSIVYSQLNGNHSNTERGEVRSEFLNMMKQYQVFLPESYHYSEMNNYPVVYIIDGDYNFLYMTGLIESYSNISEKIPEMIVVAISDNGNEGYRKDCTLKTKSNPKGNADNFIKYIETELKPEIHKNYRASSYEVLIGHSLGGLLSTTYFLKNQEAFDAYLAIDPSYWWDEEYIISYADSLFESGLAINSQLFISLANTRQMGVHSFVSNLEKHHSNSTNWSFNYYPKEDHGSVGVVSVKDGLQSVFKDYYLSRKTFYSFNSAEELMTHYKDLSKTYETKLRLPPLLFGIMIYYYFRSEKFEEIDLIEKVILTEFPASSDDFYSKLGSYYLEDKQYEQTAKILNKSIKSNDNAYKSVDVLAKSYYEQKKYYKAEEMALLAMEIAKKLKVRQWQLNELKANLVKIQLSFKN